MTGDGKRFFTIEEAERLLPRIEAMVRPAVHVHTEAVEVRTTLTEAQRRVILVGGTQLDQEFWRSSKARLERLMTEIQDKIGEILNLGAIPKDLELGLVDFPSLSDGREINLCWRLGERRIRFWHGLDEGYAGRKPLSGRAEESSCD
jgi:hypothetical protein